MISLIPALAPDEKKRVSDYLKQSEPGAEQVQQALSTTK
jgi:hypothetical protein